LREGMSTYRELFEEIVSKLFHGNDRENFLAYLDILDKSNELFNVLTDDFIVANDALGAEFQSQFWRRTLVRTSFATIEGLINSLNQTIMETFNSGFIELTGKEIEELTEQVRTRKGDLRPKFLPLGNKVSCSFAIFTRRLGGFDYSIDTTTAEWKRFESAIQVRNQLMHPRMLAEMNLGDDQISLVIDSTSWFLDTYTALQREVGEMNRKHSLENLINGRIKGILSGK
jgi:hypothetical protein